MKQFRKWAGVILRHEDEILFCKRAPEKSLGGVWSIPSGKIEKGENPGQAAIREFYEETNIELNTNLEFVGFLDKFSKEGLKKGHMFVFYQKLKEKLKPDLENAKDGFEHTECKYFSLDNLPTEKENQDLIELVKKVSE